MVKPPTVGVSARKGVLIKNRPNGENLPNLVTLFALSAGNAEMVQKLGDTAAESGKNNVAFMANFVNGNLDECLNILIKTNRLPEAAFFARTYLPSEIARVLPLWKAELVIFSWDRLEMSFIIWQKTTEKFFWLPKSF
jgi:hypothetical protein